MKKGIAFGAGLLAMMLWGAAAIAQTCETLRSVRFPDTTVTRAERVASAGRLPAICKVAATLRPTSGSDIRIEVWMPERAAWNDKYEATGNGGWGGSVDEGALNEAANFVCAQP
jgi:feruloyl esterase